MQIAYQAGDNIFDTFAKRLRKVPAWRLPWLVDELAVVASPMATAMLKDLSKKKSVAARVEEALAARSGKAKTATTGEKEKPTAKTKVKKPSLKETEARFEELTVWVAGELGKVRGKKKQERAILDEATSRYADIRTDIGEDPTEYVVHFFAADGCGFSKQREPAFHRAKPTDVELARWIELIS